MTKDEKSFTEYNMLFSSKLLEHRKYNQIKPTLNSQGKISATGNGHGPFAEFNDGSVKFDFTSLYKQSLLGYTHPLYVKHEVEAKLNYPTKQISQDKLLKLEAMPNFKELFYAFKNHSLTENIIDLLLDGFFGPNERIDQLTKSFCNQLEKLQKNNLILNYTCSSLFFTVEIKKDSFVIIRKLQEAGLMAQESGKNQIVFSPPLTLSPEHVKEAFAIIGKSLE